MAEVQTIPARHGVATFVPAGQVIKVINTSGGQVIDTWAFALPAPEGQKGERQDESTGERQTPTKPQQGQNKSASTPSKQTPKKNKKGNIDLPSQEDAEQATRDGLVQGEQTAKDATGDEGKKGWGSYVPTSYVPSLGFGKKKEDGKENESKDETEQQKNSRTWASYFPSGKGFSSYIPKQATDTVSQFAAIHQRDTSKSYLEQLTDFSKTPVGATGLKGLAAMTGSGYSGSLYAGYSAWNNLAAGTPAMEYMSMAHSRVASQHLIPRVNDSLVTNLRAPILTLIEDTSPGVHDTLIAACDPQRYKNLSVPKWEEHGSCAENLVLALNELNKRAGLKGAKAVGAQVSINDVPAPLNLFMNIPWDDDGDIGFKPPKCKAGDYVRFRAERDVVVVLSACPQDVLDTNNRNPTDAAFVVEGSEDTAAAIKRTQKTPSVKKTTPPAARKTGAAVGTGADISGATKRTQPPAAAKKPPPTSTKPPPKKIANPAATTAAPQSTPAQPARAPASRPMKKPIPPSATPSVSGGDAAEKKKPRKLTPKAN